MMYKAYGTQKTTPARLARKQARRGVYWYNYKLSKTVKKLKRQRETSQNE